GGILAFHAYHHGDFDFEAMVRRFAGALAAAMGTVVLPSGGVPTLVAREWYDDGPRDLSDRFQFLNEGSELRRSLATMAPEEFPAALERELAPLALNELTLPLIVALPELTVRPALLVALTPFMRGIAELPDHTILRVAEMLLRFDRVDLLESAIGEATG